ncbi:MAG: two-component sensor histidine kinase [Burkholderiaceae bacterium]|nr:two-component sensor histidine kinase [Burkholderiaceae bacterium]
MWLLPATFVVGALASVGTYWGATLELADLLDEQLRYVAEHVSVDGERLTVDKTNDYKRRLSDESADEVLVEVWQGQRLGYTSNAAPHLTPPIHTGLSDVTFAGQTWHTFVADRGDKLIRVAQAKDARWEALARVAVNLLWPIASLIPLLAVFLWFGIGYGLKPLREIASELSGRDASSWTPVTPHPLPSEVKPLVDALNEMLHRLERAFAAQREFIADAAHELRTPAMALSVHAELAQSAESVEEREAALAQVQQGVARLSHLTHQLLTLARVETGTQLAKPEPVDLVALCKSVILDQIHLAEAKQLDLGLAEHDVATVLGDSDNLRVLLRNLVDNAIRYTPAHGRIDVAVRREADGVVIEVRDDGPGIPLEERERVLVRFYRGNDRSEPGSELGLSIVKRIADQHGAVMSLDAGTDEKGLRVTLMFPELDHLCRAPRE